MQSNEKSRRQRTPANNAEILTILAEKIRIWKHKQKCGRQLGKKNAVYVENELSDEFIEMLVEKSIHIGARTFPHVQITKCIFKYGKIRNRNRIFASVQRSNKRKYQM